MQPQTDVKLPAHVYVEARRILDAEARRLLAATPRHLNRDPVGRTARLHGHAAHGLTVERAWRRATVAPSPRPHLSRATCSARGADPRDLDGRVARLLQLGQSTDSRRLSRESSEREDGIVERLLRLLSGQLCFMTVRFDGRAALVLGEGGTHPLDDHLLYQLRANRCTSRTVDAWRTAAVEAVSRPVPLRALCPRGRDHPRATRPAQQGNRDAGEQALRLTGATTRRPESAARAARGHGRRSEPMRGGSVRSPEVQLPEHDARRQQHLYAALTELHAVLSQVEPNHLQRGAARAHLERLNDDRRGCPVFCVRLGFEESGIRSP